MFIVTEYAALTVSGPLNINTAIVSGPGPPDLIRVCRSCAIPGNFRQGLGEGHHLCHFLSADSAGPSLA